MTLAYFTVNDLEIIESSVVNQTNHSIEADIAHFSTIGPSIRNPYPQTLVKETDFDGHLATSFRVPIGDDGVTDFGNDISLLLIDKFPINEQIPEISEYPKIRFNAANASNGWYVAVAFKKDRWLNNGWNSEPSSGTTSWYCSSNGPCTIEEFHPGEDWNIIPTGGNTGSSDAGKPVHAIANGKVLFNGWKYGNTIILGHKLESGEIVASFYGHLQSKPNLSVGALINKGDVVGNIGNTGTGAYHLHFEIAKGIGADGTSYMLKKNGSDEIIFSNEPPYTTGGQQYYKSLWLWLGTNSTLVDPNWYAPYEFINNHQNDTTGYTITDLGTLGGDILSSASGVNNSGQVVGYSYTNSEYPNAFFYSGGTMNEILSGDAKGINDSGQVVGFIAGFSNSYAFLYSGGITTNLGTLPGGGGSIAIGINNSGQIVGFSQTYGSDRAFLYSGGTMIDIGTFSGGGGSSASAINDNGQIVGYAITSSSSMQAFLYSGGTMIDIGTPFGATWSEASDINNNGDVVGNFMPGSGSGYNHAFLYRNGTMIDLGTPPGGTWSQANSINNYGQVVGSFMTTNDNSSYTHAFLYSGGTITNLKSLIDINSGWSSLDARGINDMGQIVGQGIHNGNTRAFLMTPK